MKHRAVSATSELLVFNIAKVLLLCILAVELTTMGNPTITKHIITVRETTIGRISADI